MENISLSVGRDYAAGYSNSYEFVIFKGDRVLARQGGFKSSATAKRNGVKAAQAFA